MFTEAEAGQIAEQYYGIAGRASRLPGEYDANFHLKSDLGREFLLKISHPAEVESIVAMQNAMSQCIASQDLPFAVPSPEFTISGDLYAIHAVDAEKNYYIRLFTYLPGKLLATVHEQTPALWISLGTQLGHLSASLEQFNHHAAERYLKWDLLKANWIAEHLSQLSDSDDKACVELFMQRFNEKAAATLPTLRQSVIHGDMNDYNILVMDDTHVSGFIDFGDVVKTATICELAIALAYVMMDKADPVATAAHVIKGYHAVFPLQKAEMEVLFDLVCMRLCVSVVNSAIRKKENPTDPYLVISERPAWDLLKKLRGVSEHERFSF